ncbi:WAT1-related protein [Platanthera zijinensis]|uniref:WAT1-related protein n=1 Tax=Platanthera zijinensis TaxID=2320716 RepID=A0AAP0G2P8_9ASPA
MLCFNNGGAWIEDALVVAGLIIVQVLCAFFTVFAAGFLAAGLDPLFLVASGNLINSFLLLPLAFSFERKKWPEELGVYLIIRLALIALAGTPLYQVFMLMGVKKTTPAVATAIPNLAPGVIFIIASCLRLEKFSIRCNYTKVKIGGTMMCLGGAMALSFLQVGLITCVSLSIVAWCVHKRGPVIVSIFIPIQTICATLLSAILLKQFITPASLAGMAVLFVGLYIVLWAKKKEAEGLGEGEEEKLLCLGDEKPLLC